MFLGLGIFLVWWSINQIPNSEYDSFKKALKTANYWLGIPVFFMLASSHILRALRWKLLMQPMGYKPSFANTFFAVMIGYLANLAIPRFGEVLKCSIISKYEKVPAEKLVGTIVAERAFDVICLGIVFLLAFIFQFNEMLLAFSQLKKYLQTQPTQAADGFPYVKIILLLAVVALLAWVIITKKWKLFKTKFTAIISGISEGLTSALKLKEKNKFILYTLSIWMLYLIGTWIGLYATKGTEAGLPTALSCLAFASIGMIITPGGIGAYALFLALVLELQNPSIPKSLGLANGTLQWFAQCIIVLLVGFVCLILLPIYNRNKK